MASGARPALKEYEVLAADNSQVEVDPDIFVPGNESGRKRAQTLIPEVNKALQTMTGEKYTTWKEWKTWWGRSRPRFQIKK